MQDVRIDHRVSASSVGSQSRVSSIERRRTSRRGDEPVVQRRQRSLPNSSKAIDAAAVIATSRFEIDVFLVEDSCQAGDVEHVMATCQ
jgi:hypothetical protein